MEPKTVKQLMKEGDLRPFTVEFSSPVGKVRVTGLLSEYRVDRSHDSEGKHLYDIRHSDNDWCDPATIERKVLVNWFGTLILCEPITLLENQDYLEISDYWYEDE